MLSRVISFRDAGGMNSTPFRPAPLTRASAPHPGMQTESEAEYASLFTENQALNSSIRALEAQLSVVRQEAFDTGRRQGEQHAQLELSPVLENMKQSITDTVATRADVRHRAERDAVELALRIARRILHREIATDPNSLAALAKVVFERMARSETYTLTIHPQFLGAVQSVLTGSQVSRVRIEPDAACAPGTFLIRSPEGTLDASIDTQLEEIGRGLADRLGE